MKVQATYSFVHNKLMLFVHVKGENRHERKLEDTIFSKISNEIKNRQEDLDNNFFMLEYDAVMKERIEKLYFYAFKKVEEEYPEFKFSLEMNEVKGNESDSI